jgi:hypothetical protein
MEQAEIGKWAFSVQYFRILGFQRFSVSAFSFSLFLALHILNISLPADSCGLYMRGGSVDDE